VQRSDSLYFDFSFPHLLRIGPFANAVLDAVPRLKRLLNLSGWPFQAIVEAIRAKNAKKCCGYVQAY